MRNVKLYIAASLDGKIARRDGGLDWLPDPTAEDYGYQAFYDAIDTTLMGYKTYEVCLGFGAWHYQGKTTYVFSRDASKSCVPEAQLVAEDPVAFVRRLKEGPGRDIWLVGGGQIVTLLHDAGLIDAYILAFIPVILGEGIELFPAVKAQANLRLTEHRVFSNGAVMLYLERDGALG
ncbi:MAG TPA: dihydrofolate reductase family protein [Cytophagales bacterium]